MWHRVGGVGERRQQLRQHERPRARQEQLELEGATREGATEVCLWVAQEEQVVQMVDWGELRGGSG